MKNGIIYQIFPERFARGGKKTFQEKINEGLYAKNAIFKEWNELPTKGIMQGMEFFGGDLFGVAEKISYFIDLGVDTLYINPFFPGVSNHKYDALQYKDVDKAFGGMEAFDLLLKKAHDNHIKVIIDVALNHVSNEHRYFKEAIKDKNSKYINFFKFIDYPKSYSCWWGADFLPELNLENPEIIEEFITGEKSIIKFWIEKGVDGIRLDCANDLGPKICSLVRDTAKKINPEIKVFGEVFNYSSEWQKVLDGTQSYYYSGSIFSVLSSNITTKQFGKNINKLIMDSQYERLLESINILSSHDYKRALNSFDFDIKKYFLALIMQFTLPGIPKIYYGEEVGMTGGDDPENRAPMIWDENKWNKNILTFYKKLIKLRKEKIELQEGLYMDFSEWLDNGVVGFMRYMKESPKDFSIILLNTTNEKKKFRLFVPYSYFFCDMQLVDYFQNDKVITKLSYIDVDLEPFGYRLFNPNDTYKKNYSFYKRA
ncbi:MAG TPA: glycoside hydrolase family 13 protein [Spirochaetota bacterium]|nr:glycoside hydrolase family 13 protein [Spirochaetota bacterium]